MRTTLSTRLRNLLTAAFSVTLACCGVVASGQAAPPPPPLASTAEIVDQLVQHNEERADRLTHYTAQRHYHLEYHGFPHSADATMDVEALYDAPSKTFRVLSESGSQKLINHVFKKLLTGEQEAAGEQSKNAMTPANYNFALIETVYENGRYCFVLQVDPRTSSKFLFRGRIWVDAEDYAVAKVEAQPSETLSFWIRNTQIRHLYGKVGDFWLPQQNKTITKVRLGGTAILTIDFRKYEFESASRQNQPPSERAGLGMEFEDPQLLPFR